MLGARSDRWRGEKQEKRKDFKLRAYRFESRGFLALQPLIYFLYRLGLQESIMARKGTDEFSDTNINREERVVVLVLEREGVQSITVGMCTQHFV